MTRGSDGPILAALCPRSEVGMDEDDPTERLLPSVHPSDPYDESSAAFSTEELLHSVGSFSAVMWPVTITMLLSRYETHAKLSRI